MLELKRFKGTVAVVGDEHIPEVDMTAIHVSNQVIRQVQPDVIVENGDLHDMYQISKYDKNPDRANTLQDDLDAANLRLRVLRSENPNARIILNVGTHEDRLRRYLWSGAPALAKLRCLKIEELLDLKANEIELVEFEEGVKFDDVFLVLHGDLVRVQSGYTARAMREKHGGSGMHNHTHRGGSHYDTDREGEHGWWENFCLCSLTPDYIKHPNWQQGFSIVTFVGSQRFFVEQMPIIKGKCIYGGEIFGV